MLKGLHIIFWHVRFKGKKSHWIKEWFGWEGTIKDHFVPTPSYGQRYHSKPQVSLIKHTQWKNQKQFSLKGLKKRLMCQVPVGHELWDRVNELLWEWSWWSLVPLEGLKDESHCLGFCRSCVVGNHSRMEQLSRDSSPLSSKGPLVVMSMAWSTGSVQPTGAVGEMCRNGVILL